jgi:hypothetical protein
VLGGGGAKGDGLEDTSESKRDWDQHLWVQYAGPDLPNDFVASGKREWG